MAVRVLFSIILFRFPLLLIVGSERKDQPVNNTLQGGPWGRYDGHQGSDVEPL